jgi:hypothetical protein
LRATIKPSTGPGGCGYSVGVSGSKELVFELRINIRVCGEEAEGNNITGPRLLRHWAKHDQFKIRTRIAIFARHNAGYLSTCLPAQLCAGEPKK